MKFQQTFVVLAACSILRGFLCIVMEGPSDATVLYGTDHKLNCKTAENDAPGWSEVIDDTTNDQIYLKYDRQNNDDKYNNFNISGTIPVYNLEVKSIEIEDEGVYECATTLVDGRSATLSVEVPPSNVSITCTPSTNCAAKPNEEVVSEISCTCIAFGAYPETLTMSWTGATPTSTEPSNKTSTMGPEGSFDFTQIAEESVTGTSGSVQCTLDNYVNDIEEANRTATYTYSSPICRLIVTHDQTCSGGTANLTCSCNGDLPKVNMYTFFDGDGDIIDGDTQDNVRYNVPTESDGETVFYCRGCNGVNFGDQSLSEITICEPDTTPTPMEAEVTTLATTDGGLDGAIIAVIVVVCVVFLLAVIIGTVFFFKKRGDEKGNNDNTDGNGVNAKLAEEQPEYAAVKPKSQPQAAPRPRSSQPPDNKEQMELQYADLDHGINRGRTNEIHQPADEPTQYAEVKSVIV